MRHLPAEEARDAPSKSQLLPFSLSRRHKWLNSKHLHSTSVTPQAATHDTTRKRKLVAATRCRGSLLIAREVTGGRRSTSLLSVVDAFHVGRGQNSLQKELHNRRATRHCQAEAARKLHRLHSCLGEARSNVGCSLRNCPPRQQREHTQQNVVAGCHATPRTLAAAPSKTGNPRVVDAAPPFSHLGHHTCSRRDCHSSKGNSRGVANAAPLAAELQRDATPLCQGRSQPCTEPKPPPLHPCGPLLYKWTFPRVLRNLLCF